MSYMLDLDADVEGVECPECGHDVFEYDSDFDRIICVNCATVIYFAEENFKCPFCVKKILIENTKEIQVVWCDKCETFFYVLKV